MTKKYSTLRSKLRDKLKTEGKLTRTYRRREPGETKETSHVTKDSLIARHQFCITIEDIYREQTRATKLGLRYEIKDGDIKGVCNHPEDGVCGASFTDEQVKEVNERLSGRSTGESNLENLDKESQPRPRRGRKSKAEKPASHYFCLRCEKPHTEGDELYVDHMGHKRGRGRPKKK